LAAVPPVENPALVREAAPRFFQARLRLVLMLENGRVRRKAGPEKPKNCKKFGLTVLLKSFEDAGVAAIIYTDIMRDGAWEA